MKQEFDLYEEDSSSNRLIATFYCECDLLSYIRMINPTTGFKYFIKERETTERKISAVSFEGICDWKKKKCKWG